MTSLRGIDSDEPIPHNAIRRIQKTIPHSPEYARKEAPVDRRYFLQWSVALAAANSLQNSTARATSANDASAENPDGESRSSESPHTPDEWQMELTAPVSAWDEAIPLGNGITGGLLWGDGDTVRLSLDRGDLWDNRTPEIYTTSEWNYATIRKLVAEGNQREISRLFDVPYDTIPYPTRLPGARLELTFPGRKLEKFTLNMRSATGTARFRDGEELSGFFAADAGIPTPHPIAIFTTSAPAPQLRLVAPESISQLNYPPAETGEEPLPPDSGAGALNKNTTNNGKLLWIRIDQPAESGGLRYAVVVGCKTIGERTVIAITFPSSLDVAEIDRATFNPVVAGRLTIARILTSLTRNISVNNQTTSEATIVLSHHRWWNDFWSQSDVSIPDTAIQRHYRLVRYFYGAASRRGAPPMPLQGVWTADTGTLPPWKGDYHHDLNTQYTYIAYHIAGHFDEGRSFLDFMFALSERHRRFAKEFYGVSDGLIVPGVMGFDGQPLAGWAQYSLSPTMGGWVAQHFYLHWRYTMDAEFLAEMAYPYSRDVGIALEELLEEQTDAVGRSVLRLPLSSSCEIHNNSLLAWITPNSNQDLAILTFLYRSLAEMAASLEKTEEQSHWNEILRHLEPLAVDENDVLKISRNEPFLESHRHHSHLMSIHPLGILNIENGQTDSTQNHAEVIAASLDALRAKGTTAWCGYSFAWASCLESRAGRGDAAYDYLEKFVRAFILRNGFHANGDQTHSGLSNFTYRPFTLEGNFAAMQAVHEMLLQSWGNTIRVFPAIPSAWKEPRQTVSMNRCRTEGGFEVSATMVGGVLTRLHVRATCDGELRLLTSDGKIHEKSMKYCEIFAIVE